MWNFVSDSDCDPRPHFANKNCHQKTKLVPKKTKQQYVPAGGGDDYDCPCELDEPLSCPEVLGVQFDFNTPLTAKDCKWIGALNAMVAEDESAPPIPMRKCSMPQWSESKAQATKRTAQFKALTTYKKVRRVLAWSLSSSAWAGDGY